MKRLLLAFSASGSPKCSIVRFFAGLLVLLVCPHLLRAELVYYEGFDYGQGLSLGGLGGWTEVNEATDDILVSDGSLAGPVGYPDAVGNSILIDGAGSEAIVTLPSQTTGTVYYSFLLNSATVYTTTGQYIGGFIEGGNFFRLLSGWTLVQDSVDPAKYNVGILTRQSTQTEGRVAYSSKQLEPGVTYLVVIAHTFVDGTTNDVTSLWVDPDPSNFGGEVPAPDVTMVNAITTDLTSIDNFYLQQTTAATPRLTFDELRIATSWSEVTGGESEIVPEPDYSTGFDSVSELDGAVVTGSATVDMTVGHDALGALRLDALSEVEIALSDEMQGAHVEFWVYDAATSPADPLVRRIGPRVGMVQIDGGFLGGGLIYAPYVQTDLHWVINDKTADANWYHIRFTNGGVRSEGWHKWTFDLDPLAGLTIYCDDLKVSEFDWSWTNFYGMTGLKFYGDGVDDAESQTIWIDDIVVTLKGEMQVSPNDEPPPTETGFLPDEDPAYTGDVDMLAEVKGTHPRVLLTNEKIAAIKEFVETDYGKKFLDELVDYVSGRQNWEPNTDFLTNATYGQQLGCWDLPSLSLHYLITGDTASLDQAIKLLEFLKGLTVWESGDEQDVGMSAGNVMMGAAIAYDWLYDELDPTFREEFRQILWQHARIMYYGGHLGGLSGASYWSGDPGTNHRFHRNAGFSAAVLAAYEGNDSERWLLAKMKEEVEFVVSYLADDGSSRESPTYYVFGLPYIVNAAMAVDQSFGTELLDKDYFRNAVRFRSATTAPNLLVPIPFGDDAGDHLGFYNAPLYALAWKFDQHDGAAFLDDLWAAASYTMSHTWMALIGWDGHFEPELGKRTHLAEKSYFPDIEVTIMRDSWLTSGVAAMFKCGPMGGYTLNEFRDANDFKYINVAHDDPDANTFSIFAKNPQASNDGYSHQKLTSNHNTILVDGLGQRQPGRSEGSKFSQPSTAKETMTGESYLTTWVNQDEIALSEGEAAGTYIDSTLTRYRRGFIWREGRYVLVVDDIRATEQEEITWMVQGRTVTVDDALAGRFTLKYSGLSKVSFRMAATVPVSSEVVTSTVDNKGTSLGLQQLQASMSGAAVQVATVFSAWGGDVAIDLVKDTEDAATITVTGPDYVDVWTWTAAPDDNSAGHYVLTSESQIVFDSAADAWGGHGVVMDSYVDTSEDWLGWLYLADGTDWVWSYKLSCWIYADDPGSDALGVWGWISNYDPGVVVDNAWGGYSIDGAGYIDTGSSWFGSAYVEHSPWIVMDKLNSWVFANDPGAGAGGVWCYFLNFGR